MFITSRILILFVEVVDSYCIGVVSTAAQVGIDDFGVKMLTAVIESQQPTNVIFAPGVAYQVSLKSFKNSNYVVSDSQVILRSWLAAIHHHNIIHSKYATEAQRSNVFR